MTYSHAKGQGHRSVNSEDSANKRTDGQMDGRRHERMEAIALLRVITRSVTTL